MEQMTKQQISLEAFSLKGNIIQNGKMLNLTLLTFITTAWSKGLRLDHPCIIFTHQI